MKMLTDKKGMTIIEMIIVSVIIGILASIAIVTYINTRKHAVATEAIVGLSSLKQVMKHYYAEYGQYQPLSGYLDPDGAYPAGVNANFVAGTYFQDKCYKIVSASTGGRIYCYPARSDNPYGARVADGDDTYIALDLNGTFSQHNVSCLGYKSE
jgi:prepilin-type N-terminal cleavage/methylation domain-containing protein